MLLRLDPDRNAIAVMSIPRDLKVEIPGYGTGKFNEAYAYGGPKLTLQTVKQLTGLPINHVVNVDFLGFVRAVDAIGCVYVDVDRRYFHSNAGLPASEQYSEINVQPGYQLLCGKKALAVRALPPHRHRPRPLGPPAGLHQRRPPAGLGSGPGLRPERPDRHLHQIHDLRHQRQGNDVAGAETVPRLAQRRDQGGPLPGRTRAQLRLHDAGSGQRSGQPLPRASKPAAAHAARSKTAKKAAARRRRRAARRARRRRSSPKSRISKNSNRPAATAWCRRAKPAKLEAKAAARKLGSGFPVFYPSRLPSGAYYAESNSYEHIQDPRVYHLKDTDEERHAAYRMVGVLELDGRHPLLRDPGDPGLVGPADPQQSEPDQDHSWTRIRHLRRRRSGQNDRLAPW